ncbi:LysR family transcriptional regulator [Pseudobdellovibrio sp. HCB154]|uniref:LysR family transcriptional regulator n=1 Tax=Pseudobdellovibrio sp. HCB154 TaxID=3386277 RepID=UPI0039174F63
MINQTDLKYFLELSQTLHLTRASERLGITQPALSHCVKRLESDLNCQLFLRSKKGVQLTPAGIKLKQSANSMIMQWENLKQNIADDIETPQGIIKLGCHSAVAQYILPSLLKTFLKKNPGIEVQLTHGLSRHMTEQVVSSVLDVAFAVNPVAHPDLIIKEICRDEVCLWKAKNCQNDDVLIIEPGLLQTQDILQKLNKKGFTFKRVIESSSLEVIAKLVAEGVGCGIVPERVLQSYESQSYEKVKAAPQFSDKICLVYKQEFRKIKRGQIFIESVMASI